MALRCTHLAPFTLDHLLAPQNRRVNVIALIRLLRLVRLVSMSKVGGWVDKQIGGW